MRTMAFLLVIAAFVFAGFTSGSWADAQSNSGYQIKDADRGTVRRVKVLLNGRTIATLFMSRGRTGSTTHCCTPAGCKEIAPTDACTTFKMVCDKDGACKRV